MVSFQISDKRLRLKPEALMAAEMVVVSLIVSPLGENGSGDSETSLEEP